MGHPVDHRISHVDVGGGHVDLGAEYLLTVLILALPHLLKQAQILLHGAIAVRTLLSGGLKISPVLPDLIRRQVADKGLALLDEKDSTLVHLLKIVGGEEQPVLVVGTQPLHVRLDGLHKLHLLLGGVGVVEAKVEFAAVLFRQPVVQQNGLGVSDVQVAVGLRRETGLHVVVHALRQVLFDLLLDKVFRNSLFLRSLRCGHFLFHICPSTFFYPKRVCPPRCHVEPL